MKRGTSTVFMIAAAVATFSLGSISISRAEGAGARRGTSDRFMVKFVKP